MIGFGSAADISLSTLMLLVSRFQSSKITHISVVDEGSPLSVGFTSVEVCVEPSIVEVDSDDVVVTDSEVVLNVGTEPEPPSSAEVSVEDSVLATVVLPELPDPSADVVVVPDPCPFRRSMSSELFSEVVVVASVELSVVVLKEIQKIYLYFV